MLMNYLIIFDRIDVTPNVGFAKGRFDKSSVLRRSDNLYEISFRKIFRRYSW